MQLEEARQRLIPLPADWPRLPRAIEPRVILGRGSVPGVPRPPSGPTRRGAALVLLYADEDGEAIIPLTLRPTGDMRHAGEVSLPGGAVEAGESNVAAALREASEEIAFDALESNVEIVGELPAVDVRVSGFRLVPVLAFASNRPKLRPDPREVAAIVQAPLAAFLPDAPVEIVEEERGGVLLRYGAFRVGSYRVWGATARVLGVLGAALVGAEPTRARRSTSPALPEV